MHIAGVAAATMAGVIGFVTLGVCTAVMVYIFCFKDSDDDVRAACLPRAHARRARGSR